MQEGRGGEGEKLKYSMLISFAILSRFEVLNRHAFNYHIPFPYPILIPPTVNRNFRMQLTIYSQMR